jgi:hypothetical protein
MYNLAEIKEFQKSLSVNKVISNKATRSKFIEVYNYAFDEFPECEGCPSSIEQAIHKMKILLNLHSATDVELIKSKNLMKYQMKNNVRIYSNNLKLMITKYNCTDAIAESLIKEKDSNIDLFIINAELKKESEVIQHSELHYEIKNEEMVIDTTEEMKEVVNEVVTKKKSKKSKK